MNKEGISSLPDSFSWKRMYCFGMTYRRQMGWYLLICALLIAGFGILNLLVINNHPLFKSTFFILSFTFSYLLYLSPLVFSGRDEVVTYLVPASIKEKLTFYVVFSLVVVPAVMYFIWFLYCIAGSLITGESNFNIYVAVSITDTSKLSVPIDDIVDKMSITWNAIAGFSLNGMIIMLTLWVVMVSRRHRVVKAILTPVGALFMVGVVSGIIGVINGFMNVSDNFNPETVEMTIISNILSIDWIAILVGFAVIAAFIAHLYNRLKKSRIL